MDDFLSTLGIDAISVHETTPVANKRQVKSKKKKNPSPEKLERRRLQMEFEEQCRIKREEKRNKPPREIISGFGCLAKLPNELYFTACKKYMKSLEARVKKLQGEMMHTRPIQDLRIASFTRKTRLKKYRKGSKIYDLPQHEVDRILSLTK